MSVETAEAILSELEEMRAEFGAAHAEALRRLDNMIERLDALVTDGESLTDALAARREALRLRYPVLDRHLRFIEGNP